MGGELTLAQEFVLMAVQVQPNNKSRLYRSYLQIYSIGGAIIEMLLDGHITWNKKEQLVEETPCACQCSGKSQILELIRSTRKLKTMRAWMSYFAYRTKIRENTFEKLVEPLLIDGQLREEKIKVMLIFTSRRYIVSSPVKDAIIRRLRYELLEDGQVDEQTAALAMLLDVSKQLRRFFSEYEQMELSRKLENLHTEQSGNWRAIEQIKKAIRDMEATSAAIITTTSSA